MGWIQGEGRAVAFVGTCSRVENAYVGGPKRGIL